MGPELELETRSDGNKAFSGKEHEGHSIETKDEHMKCESSQVYALNMDKCIVQSMLSDGREDMEVKDKQPSEGGNGVVKADYQDSTESSSSSSFDDTASESEDASSTIDAEVGSNIFTDNPSMLDVNAFGELLRIRRKKLTSHWRAFVQPLMWRCKWAELQVKKLRELAIKYDKKLVDSKRNSPVEGIDLKPLQFPGENPADKVMKRKKRRRVEDTTNPATYVSNHPVLSYFDNKSRAADGSLDEDFGNLEKVKGTDQSGFHGERFWLESGVGDNLLEELFRKIGLLQMQAREMKCRLGQVMTENPGPFSCTNDMGMAVPTDLTNSARSLAFLAKNGDRMTAGSSRDPSQLTSFYTMGKEVVAKGAVPSDAEGSFISNVIEGSNQSLQGNAFMRSNNLMHWPAEDDVLIYDERLKAGMKNYDDLGIPMEKTQVVIKEEPESTLSKALSESELLTDVQQTVKITSISETELQTDVQQPKMRSISKMATPKKRRRRGRWKSGSGKQSRRSSG